MRTNILSVMNVIACHLACIALTGALYGCGAGDSRTGIHQGPLSSALPVDDGSGERACSCLGHQDVRFLTTDDNEAIDLDREELLQDSDLQMFAIGKPIPIKDNCATLHFLLSQFGPPWMQHANDGMVLMYWFSDTLMIQYLQYDETTSVGQKIRLTVKHKP